VLEPVGSKEFAKAVADVYPKIAKFSRCWLPNSLALRCERPAGRFTAT